MFLNQYYCHISKEEFDEKCKYVLDQFEKLEEKYQQRVSDREPFDEKNFYNRFSRFAKRHWLYIIGTVFAFYTLKNGKKEQMVYLSDHINSEKYASMSVFDILKTVGIDVENTDLDVFMDIIEDKIKENECKSKKYI